MDIKGLREKIDEIDGQLVKLFEERMRISGDIGRYKSGIGMPVLDPERERAKLKEIYDSCDPQAADYAEKLYSYIFELSRSYQNNLKQEKCETSQRIADALESTPEDFPVRPTVACQGEEGSYSQQAAEKLFKRPGIMHFGTFEDVFSAIKQGLCTYGVLPVENSTAGSVNRIYDLMMENDFSIIRSIRVKVDHCLLANRGTKISDIREIYSHSQAISQCSDFLRTLKDVKIIPCENTAAAAKAVSESGKTDRASISSGVCAGLYDLDCLSSSIQNNDNNYTRFICISKNLEIYPGSDKTSIMMILPHRPGALYRVLACFYALGINLIKLESRPLPGSNFEFMFYFDLDASVYSPEFKNLFDCLEGLYTQMKYLGSYSEMV